MAKKKQSRRSISVRKGTYAHLQEIGATRHVSISDFVEEALKHYCVHLGLCVPPPAVPGVHKPAPKMAAKMAARARAEAVGVVKPAAAPVVREMPPAPPAPAVNVVLPVRPIAAPTRRSCTEQTPGGHPCRGYVLSDKSICGAHERQARKREKLAQQQVVAPAIPPLALAIAAPAKPATPVCEPPARSSIRWMTARELARALGLPPVMVRRALARLETQQRILRDKDRVRASDLAILDVRNGTIRPIDNASRIIHLLAQPKADEASKPAPAAPAPTIPASASPPSAPPVLVSVPLPVRPAPAAPSRPAPRMAPRPAISVGTLDTGADRVLATATRFAATVML